MPTERNTDVKVKHKKTGLVKMMPIKVFNQVKAKYKLVEEQPAKVLEPVKTDPPKGKVSKKLIELRAQYKELAGEDADETKSAKELEEIIKEMTTPDAD